MSRMGIEFEDEILELLLLNSLSGSSQIQSLMGSVLNEEKRRKAQGSLSWFEVLVTKNRGRS
ncbi:hypothetical protein CR513_06051, partial [Mucuna pruriens]